FTGFPWLMLGYSQIDAPVAGYAPLAGVAGCSLVVMTAAALLVAAWEWRHGRMPAAAIGGCAALLAGGALLGRLEFTQPLERGLEAALIQGAVPQSLKWD